MTVFDDALDAIYADPNFGIAALYRPVAGADKPVTLLAKGEDRTGFGEIGAVIEGERARVRVSEVAEPAEGDLVECEDPRLAGRFRVASRSREHRRRQWILVLQHVEEL